ncbi:MAG: tetratricopeptide repeat protein [Rariglobus sp.]
MPSPNADDLKQTQPRQSTPQTGLKRFFPFSIRRKSQGWQVQIYWKQLGLFLVTCTLLGWLGAASAAYLFVKYRRGFTDVQFTHMLLLPARWDEYQIARGEFLIKNAQKDLKNEKFREAFYGLRLGLIKSPANKDARLLLAQFYGLWKRPDLTRLTLLDGFSYHKNNTDYLKTLFSFLLQQQDDQQVLAYYKELLANDTSINPRNQLVALAAASSCYFRGNYDEAETILRRYQLEFTRDGRLLVARISWDRGLREQAVDRLRELTAEFPNDEEIYTQTVAYLRESGRDNEARRESFMRALGNPRNARARIDQLYAFQKEGNLSAVKTNAEEIFSDFSTDSNALLALADFAANSGNPELARRIYDHAKARNLNWEGAALMTVEANIVAKQYQPALELVRELLKNNPEWGKRFYSVFNGLQAIANYGLGDAEAAQLFLNNFLSQSNVRADNLIAVSKRLMSVGARAQARQVLDQAVKTDALNQAALTNLIQLDLDLNNTAPLAGNVRKLLTMRRPSQDVLKSAYRKLGSDLFLFAPDRTALLSDLRAAISTPLTSS